ncbi:MAG: hypothetical protein MJZ86_01505 [Bacteroidales bacterium]|nr:hypothetical protein [Bacteroidales bacterium]
MAAPLLAEMPPFSCPDKLWPNRPMRYATLVNNVAPYLALGTTRFVRTHSLVNLAGLERMPMLSSAPVTSSGVNCSPNLS